MEREGTKSFRQNSNGGLASAAPYVLCGIVLVLLPLFVSQYFQTMMTKVFIFAILAMSLNLIFGYAGLVSLGHAAYFGVGAYTTGMLILRLGIKSFWLAAPGGVLMSIVFAALFGVIALRFSGVYFLMITFALGELLFSAAWKWRSMTGGDDGLWGIPAPELGLSWLSWNRTCFYYLAFLVLVVSFLALYRIIKSPFGRTLIGIRENETRMRSLGYNALAFKYLAFVLAGLFAGVAGVLFAYFRGFVSPSNLGIETSGLVLFIVIIGGSGTLCGPLIGTLFILLLEHFSSIYFPERWPMLLGFVFIVVAAYLQGGIGIYLVRLWDCLRYRHTGVMC